MLEGNAAQLVAAAVTLKTASEPDLKMAISWDGVTEPLSPLCRG